MSTWQVEIDYGSGWVDLTSYGGENLIQRGSIQPKFVLHNDKFEPVQDSVKFTAYLNTTLANTLLNVDYDQTILCRIHKDSSDYFYGYLRPVTKYSVGISERWIEFEALDNSYRLLNKPATRIEWESYKVCDTSNTSASIVHQLLEDAGYTLATDVAITEDINVTVSVYSAEEDKKEYRKLLTELLYDYGYVYYFNASGEFDIYQWRADSVPTPTTTFDSSNTPAGGEVEVTVEDIEEKTFVVWYYDIVTEQKELYRNSNETLGVFISDIEGKTIPTTQRHNLSLGSGDILQVEDLRVNANVSYFMSSFLGSGFWPLHSFSYDGTTLQQNFGSVSIHTWEAYNTYVDFRFTVNTGPPVGTGGWLKYNIYGEVSRRVKAGEATAGTGGTVEEYKAKNITTASEAQKLAQALLKNNINGRYKYKLETETDADLGEYCTVANTALNITTTARVIKKEFDTEAEIYQYELIGVDELGTITATDQPLAIEPEVSPDELTGGIPPTVSGGVNQDGSIAQAVEGNKLADADTSTAWRTYVGPYKVGTQISDIGATTWTDRAYWGGDAGDDWPSIGKSDGLASWTADLSDLDIGDEIPTGATVWQFNNNVLDLSDTDHWDTETGVDYTTASRFGSHALQPVTGGSITLVDDDAQGIDFSGDFSFSGWWYFAENPSGSFPIMDFQPQSGTVPFVRLRVTATGVQLWVRDDTSAKTEEITLSISGWFFVGVSFDQSTLTWTLVVNDANTTLVSDSLSTTASSLSVDLYDGNRLDDLMIIDGTALSAAEFDAHFDSGYPWATEDADGNLYLIPKAGKEVVVKGAFRVGEGEHDTGWILCNDFANEYLGDTVGGNLNHGFGMNLNRLDVKLFISEDGTDGNSFEIGDGDFSISTGILNAGYTIYQVDTDNIKIQTGSSGLQFHQDGFGTRSSVTTQGFYYRVIVRVAAPAKGDTGDTGPAGPTGPAGADGEAGEKGDDGATSLAVAYDTGTDYVVGDAVYHDNILWQCVQANGPSTTVVEPGTDTDYWQNYPRFFTSSSEPTGSDGADGDLWFTYTV